MSTNCTSLLVDIFLYSYEAGFTQSLLSVQSHRYIDGILSINNPGSENYLGQKYPSELEIQGTSERASLLLTFIYFCQLGGMVNFTLPFTTNEMISISTSLTFHSWADIFHLRRPMAFLSLSLYDTSGLAPQMDVVFWGPGVFPVISFSNRDTSWNAWNRHSESFMVDNGSLFATMKSTSHEF